jgi:type V secretory pathway adhesin AidA
VRTDYIEALARRDSMEAYKIENKHGIILYDSMIAGVELEDQEETEDPPEEEAEEEAQEVEENEEAEAQPNQEIDRTQEENNNEEDDEEALQGAVQPMVRRSSRATTKRAVLNIGENNTKTYDAQLHQSEDNEIEYCLPW